jgi:aminoglycoside phosphotransferase (APT) family kinase protein
VRPSWDELPGALRDGLAGRVGQIAAAHVQSGGFTPGLAVRLRLASGGRVFAKGIPAGHALAGKYRAEARTARLLPAAAPAPRLRWDGEIAGWFVLVFEDIDGRHADLSPGSADVGLVVAAVADLGRVLTPCPVPDAASAVADLAGLVHGWRQLADAPSCRLDEWARRHLESLAAAETAWLSAADGQTLVHGDISASNLLVTDAGRVLVVDWAQPACGASWLDVADLVPHLILAGHEPGAAEGVLAGVPAWGDTDPDVLTSYATAFAGYWIRMSGQPDPPGVPNLRAYQARAGAAALAWVRYRTGWA